MATLVIAGACDFSSLVLLLLSLFSVLDSMLARYMPCVRLSVCHKPVLHKMAKRRIKTKTQRYTIAH